VASQGNAIPIVEAEYNRVEDWINGKNEVDEKSRKNKDRTSVLVERPLCPNWIISHPIADPGPPE